MATGIFKVLTCDILRGFASLDTLLGKHLCPVAFKQVNQTVVT